MIFGKGHHLSSVANCVSEQFDLTFLGVKMINSRIQPCPITLTISCPFQSSHTSFEVDDISSASTTARLSLALPVIALSHGGPLTRMALTMMVITPNGAIATMMLSAHPVDWLMNCVVTLSPNSVKILEWCQLRDSLVWSGTTRGLTGQGRKRGC